MPAINVADYRKHYEQQLSQVTPAAAKGADAAPDHDDLAETFARLVAAASDRGAPVDRRVSALQELAALEFLGPRFSPFKVEYVATLRTLATDRRATVRRSALESLALRKDPEGRALLVRGLEKPAEALVPEAIALQFLSHDDHGEVVPLVRRVYRRSKGAARAEALRILANDPESEALLKRLMTDKSEKSGIRRLSASALQHLNPDTFEKAARRIVADDSEFNEIRSTSLTALSQRASDRPANAQLVEQVTALHKSARSPALKASSARFLDAHGADRPS